MQNERERETETEMKRQRQGESDGETERREGRLGVERDKGRCLEQVRIGIRVGGMGAACLPSTVMTGPSWLGDLHLWVGLREGQGTPSSPVSCLSLPQGNGALSPAVHGGTAGENTEGLPGPEVQAVQAICGKLPAPHCVCYNLLSHLHRPVCRPCLL